MHCKSRVAIRCRIPSVTLVNAALISTVALGMTLLTARAQRDFANVVIKDIPAAGCVHMLEGAGGNVGASAGPDGILIVDDQFEPLADRIREALGKIGSGKPRFLINTHWHGDHTGGNAQFGKDAVIVAHRNVRERLGGKSDTPKAALPVVTFDQTASVHFNGEEIRIIHLGPGHTDGDSVVHFKTSNVVHMGDQFFSGRFPFIDLGSGGDVAGYIRNVEAVLTWIPADAKVIPGHGPLSTVEDLRRFHAMLVETTGIVRKAIQDGKTLEQVKAEGLPEKWKEWGAGFINTPRWLEISYNSLKGK